ncbi:MAG TPA: DUF1109 domain-containing protein [Steroidobacteraceae bacterium]
MKTESLIRLLAADAGRPVNGIGGVLRLAWAGGAAGSLLLFELLLGPRANLAWTYSDVDFIVKIACMACLAFTAALELDAVARPLRRGRRLHRLGLAPLLLLVAVILELGATAPHTWLTSIVVRNAVVCLAAIPVLSAPPALLLMFALKRGAPTRPRVAGAIAGLASGGIGACLYAFFCPVDNALFVATWYPLAIGTVTATCAMAGRWLRW